MEQETKEDINAREDYIEEQQAIDMEDINQDFESDA
jgi:hypothetical protein